MVALSAIGFVVPAPFHAVSPEKLPKVNARGKALPAFSCQDHPRPQQKLWHGQFEGSVVSSYQRVLVALDASEPIFIVLLMR